MTRKPRDLRIGGCATPVAKCGRVGFSRKGRGLVLIDSDGWLYKEEARQVVEWLIRAIEWQEEVDRSAEAKGDE